MYFLKKYRRGIKNRYTKKTPLPEIILKDIIFTFQELENFFKNKFKSRTILAYPHLPSRKSSIYKLCRHMHFNLTNNINRKFDVAIYWEYGTYLNEFQKLEEIHKDKRVINLNIRDISKKHVDQKFREIFGYSTFVDPLQYQGKCVKKSNINALHDGEIIDCPVSEKDDRFVYQIPLDNLKENGKHEDIRIPVIANKFPLVFLQYRSVNNRFSIAIEGEIKPRHEVLSGTETKLIQKLCRAVGLEFGELDAIRHQKDGKLYVIDINNTPSSRFRLFSKAGYKPFLDKQKELFLDSFIYKYGSI